VYIAGALKCVVSTFCCMTDTEQQSLKCMYFSFKCYRELRIGDAKDKLLVAAVSRKKPPQKKNYK
jgi:hypothetical protein